MAPRPTITGVGEDTLAVWLHRAKGNAARPHPLPISTLTQLRTDVCETKEQPILFTASRKVAGNKSGLAHREGLEP